MKKFFIVFCVVSLLLVAYASIVIYFKSGPKQRSYWIKNYQFRHFDYLHLFANKSRAGNMSNFPAGVHEIESGQFIVFGHREFNDPELMSIDDEEYLKLTIQITPDYLKNGKVITLPDPNVKIAYSDGGAAWPSGGCHGYASEGSIAIKQLEDAYELDLKLKLSFLDVSWGIENCDQTYFKKFVFEPIEGNDLTPALGSRATTPYSATYGTP